MAKTAKSDRTEPTRIAENLTAQEVEGKLILELDPNEIIGTTQRGHAKIVDANWETVQQDDTYKWVIRMILIRKRTLK
jgi:hypothetical protein